MKKSFLRNRIIRSALMVAIAGLACAPNQLLAQEKGAERLMNLSRRSTAPTTKAAAPKTLPMACPKCQDVVKQVPNMGAKGGQILMAGGRPTISVTVHQCEGCSTIRTTVGHGKAKKDIAQHTCTACGADSRSCCDITGQGSPTKGM